MPDLGVAWPQLNAKDTAAPAAPAVSQRKGRTPAPVSGDMRYTVTVEGLAPISAAAEMLRAFRQQSALEAERKDPANAARLDEVLYNLAEVCRILAVLVWPFLPGTAGRIFTQLALTEAPDKFALAKWGGLKPGREIGTPQALFPRKDTPGAA